MRRINPAKAGLAVGFVIAIWHLTWVTLVATGAAKPFMDFVLGLHFIGISYGIEPFVLGTAVLLVAITFCIGAAFGLVFALVWNWLSRPPEAAPTHERPGTRRAA